MKTTFDASTRAGLIYRIKNLTDGSTAIWGKMNVFQMVKHCCVFEEMINGTINYKQAFIGKLFGKMALKSMLKGDRPMGKSSPTAKEFIIAETSGDLEKAKQRWISLLEAHADYAHNDFIHPFFGKLTKEQTGQLAYKHYDHHLRQFNV